MIEQLSRRIVSYLIKYDAIEDTEYNQEFYQYGIEIMLSTLLGFLLVIIIGTITSRITECIIFLVVFVPIRQFTGGYHTDTYFKCNSALSLICVVLLILYNLTTKEVSLFIALILAALSILIIIILAPIENPNKPIPKEKRKKLKIISIILSISYAIPGVFLILFSVQVGLIIIYTLAIISVLMIYSKNTIWR